jgi:hypothetical protein
MAREEAEMAAGGRACSLTTVKWGTTGQAATGIIHPSAWKENSANFALTEFSEL